MRLLLREKPNARRKGHSLIELVAAMASSAVLLVGLGSVILIASRGSDLTGPTSDTIRASELAHELMDEIRYAIFITDRSANMIQFAVADRDADGEPEVIRYEWSGTPGDPLTRTYNHGTADTVAEDVDDFTLTYNIREKAEEFEGLVESSEALLKQYTGSDYLRGWVITPNNWLGQYFHPDDFSPALPSDATSWKVTKVEFVARIESAAIAEATVQLRPATGDCKPTSTVLAEVPMYESALSSSYTWETFTFANAPMLSPNAGICLVIKRISGSSAGRIRYDDYGGIGRVWTYNSGASWSISSADDSMQYKVYGKYKQPGDTQTVTRRYLTGVDLSMQIGDSGYSKVNTGTNLLNTPELLSAYWKVDFDADPTTADADFDGSSDWTEESGSFNTASLVGGVWQADQSDGVALRTLPDNDFTESTTVDIKCRNTSVGGLGANFWMHFDRTGGDYGEVYTSVALQTDGTQTARIYSGDGTNDALLLDVPDLSSDFVHIRLVIVPDTDLVAVWVNQVFRGTFDYFRFNNHSKRYFIAQPSGSDAEFDYISVRVSDSS
ncbi:MAG: hypothetical protein H8E44_12245 [Planctomycetes bacterium]|nr:hypothetical protein [Planctomycetota bacterium]